MNALAAEAVRLDDGDARQPPPPASTVAAEAADATPDSLVRRFADGDRAAFERFVELYHERVRRLAGRLQNWHRGGDGRVDDAVQDVFLAALRNAARVRARRDEDLWPWLATITVNTCRSARRREWVRQTFLFKSAGAAPRESAGADQVSENEETLRQVRDAVERLPGRDREVIVLHYLEGMRAPDIAAVLGVSANAIEVRLHRARARLKEQLTRGT